MSATMGERDLWDADAEPEVATCWLAGFSDRVCQGRLRRVHLVEKGALKRRGYDPWDERSWVWACGGETGLEGHHGLFDSYRLVLPPDALPEAVIEMCREFQMMGYLFRRYGYEG